MRGGTRKLIHCVFVEMKNGSTRISSHAGENEKGKGILDGTKGTLYI